ncbi:RNA polymerase sigma factor [Actinacidiphila bryophytorum]|uniref:Uncharacterized protein n=1 Tax=Actinacidiphila bryophytorum TaxID=1436133 RepID=A0A9W4ML87_9ACTN|nr:hypothetical protein [Actinacidiphila bryophytorum]MBM9438335.1 hypothetical protein [Actinacidiphila bryophytorum]MBN6542639.1 hypothetical protein [Actinacidiphila bryophytorum]CAG7658061.1 hypothetical protein SBRY_90134 [Actinacidiphila bryophytorum]
MNISARRRGAPERDLGDLEAFYRRHVEDVTRFVSRRFDEPHTVADVVADVFLAVVDSGDYAYRSAARNERAWLRSAVASPDGTTPAPAAAAAAGAILAVVPGGSSTPAYAVEAQKGGTVKITFHDALKVIDDRAKMGALETELRAAGINVVVDASAPHLCQ